MPHKSIEGLKDLNPNGFGGMCSKSVLLNRANIDFEKGIDTVATTDAPALIIDWERWQVVREILPMRYAEMPVNDKVPLLDSHSRFSIEMIKGSATNWTVTASELMAKTFVSKSEENVRQKIEEGHIDSVSIGYETSKEYTVEIPKKATVVIDGAQYKNEFEDDYPLLVRTWWKTKELSLVPIGADEAAKFKSIHDDAQRKLLTKLSEHERMLAEILEEVRSGRKESKEFDRQRLRMRLAIMKHELNLN
jgi:hypothetical protein